MIVEFGGRFLIWNPMTDAPASKLMCIDGLKAHMLQRYGEKGLSDFQARMDRVMRHGTSSTRGLDKLDLLTINRAGPGASSITCEKEMIRTYS